MFQKDFIKRTILIIALALFVLLIPFYSGMVFGVEETSTENEIKISLDVRPQDASKRQDLERESGERLLTIITEKNRSDFVASFSKDQQMIRDYASSAGRMATVSLNPAAVAPGTFSPGDRLIVEVSEDTYYAVNVEKTLSDRKSDIIRGQVEGSYFGFFHMSTTEGQTMVALRVPEENRVYHIVYSNSGHYQLFEFAIDQFEQYEDLPPRIPDEYQASSPREQERVEQESPASQPGTAGSPGPNDPATIDVMVVYTPAARDWAGGSTAVNNVINQAMLRAQEANDNSNTGITMRLVHTAEVSYSESNLNQSLDDITYGFVSNVHAMRNTYGADLVAFFPYHNNGGGLAWLYWYNDPLYGYSVSCVTAVSSTYLAIHEMGHNMGGHHHKQQNFQPGPHPNYSYAAGWRFQVGSTWYNTLMSYSDGYWFPDGPGPGITSIEVGYFSTPLINYPGSSVPVGHAADGDNARLLRETKHGVAAFRLTTSSSYNLTVNSTNPTSGVAIESSSGHTGATSYNHTVPQNASVTLTAPEYHGSGADRKVFDNWSGSHPSSNRTITFTMDSNKTVTANYVDDPAVVIFGEHFDSSTPWPPTGWNRYQLSATTINWSYDSGYALHDYDMENHVNNWLVTPAITLPVQGTLIFSFLEANNYFDWYTYSGVWISAGSGNPSSGDFVELYESNVSRSSWAEKTIDLSSYAGQTVYIGYRYAGFDGHIWRIDDIIISGSSTPQTGSIEVNIEPVAARTAGAQWSLTSGPDTGWKNSGETITDLAPGSYMVIFKDVAGWNTPANSPVTVTAGQTATVTGIYTEATYILAMAATPEAGGTTADLTGAGPYAAGAAVSIKAEPSTGYTFSGWSAPAGSFADASALESTFTMPDQNVTVTANFTLLEPVNFDFSVSLSEGWNLLSLYRRASHIAIESSDIGAWLGFREGAWVNSGSLSEELNNPARAVFIKAIKPTEVHIKWDELAPGDVFASQQLVPGWNLISSGIKADCNAVLANIRYNGTSGLTQLFAPNFYNGRKEEGYHLPWVNPLVNLIAPAQGSGEHIYPFDGYWVYLGGAEVTYSTPVGGDQ